MFQSVREEEETAATEKVEIELEGERNRLTVEIENEQRVTLGTKGTLIKVHAWIKAIFIILVCSIACHEKF